MQVSRDTTHTARKPHRCYWCGEVIEVGTPYVRWANFVDGGVSVVSVHPECKEAWDNGYRQDWAYYGEEVSFGLHHRGCLCENGACECKEGE